MKNSRAYAKLISGILAGILLLMSPGFPAYQALAAEAGPAGAAGLPAASWAPMMHQLAAPQAGLSDSMVGGVAMGPLLQTLSSVDLDSAEGRLQVQPVALALSRLPAGATKDQAIAAIAGAVASVRAQASGDLSQRGTAQLENAARYPLLLEPAQVQALSQELVSRREASAQAILSGAKSWNGNGGGAFGAAGREAVTRAQIGVAASELQRSTSKARAETRDVEKIRRKTAIVQALAAGTGLIALFHGVSLLTLAVALGSMLSIVAHEAAHLAMARAQGDDTARKQGVARATQLIDPLGTVALPAFTAALTGALFGAPLVFGWAKPVPIDFNRPGNVKRSSGLIAAAGPLANFALAAGLGLTIALAHPAGFALAAIATLAKINVLLGAFNLLPAGPQFDGFKVLVSFLPRKLYERLTKNERVAPAYQSTFQKLYEGPSALLNAVGMDGQGRVNRVTRLWTLGAFALFALASYAWLGEPVLLLALVCSYDYYCIREKIQNEAAVKALTDILQGFSSELAKAAEEDETIQSTINTEEVEHVLKNALEDILDKVIDSEGFDSLTEDQKWERFKDAYTDAAVTALHQKGMSADSEETIRNFLHKNGSRFFEQLKGWAQSYDVFTKWHSPKRKSDSKDELSQRGEKLKNAGKAMAVLGAAFLGAHFGLPHAAMAGLGLLGAVAATAPSKPKTPTFQEAMEDPNLKLDAKSKAFLLMMLSEMKLEEKPPVIGRIDQMSEVYKNVTAPRGGINSVVLIGEAGVGKTAIPEKLAQALALAELQPDGTFALNKMKGRYLMKLNLSRLLSQDDPPKALDALIGMIENFNDAPQRSGNKIVLFIDEIHQIFLHPKGDLMANILKEPLRDGRLAIIAATTRAEYKKYMESDEAFRRRMVPVPVQESSVAETLRMLQGTRAYYEGLYQVMIHPDALKTAAELSKYDQELFLPGRAFHPLTEALKDADYDGRRDRLGLAIADAISELQYMLGRLTEELKTTDRVTEKIKGDEPTTIELYNAAVALSKKLVELYRQRDAIPTEGTPVVTADMVKEQIAKKTGVKSGMLTLGREPMDRYLDMEKIVGARVIGQNEAVHAIAEAVRRNKAGLSDPKRPLGVFYLTGPTGSGKTHLAKELARFLFDDPEAVIRLDMSEYMESHSPAKMIGSPPGYVGYGEGGQLTEKVRKKPYSVVLFDEIEKANPDVWLILLQILGDARLTDGQGRTVDFKNTIILMTSNLGMYALNDMLEPYIKAFQELQGRLDAAHARGDSPQVAEIERQQRELSEKLAKETKQETEKVTKEAFKKTYPPEFEGRLSAPPIVFNRITPEMAADIVQLNLKELSAVMDYAGHELAPPSPDVVKFLVEKGFDVRLGARPLQNAIDRYISQPVAQKLLEAAKANGDTPKPSRVVLSVKNGAIAIDVAPLPPKAVSKQDAGQGAAQEVFSQALNLAMHAASDKVAPEATLEVIDAWVRAALDAYPTEAAPAPRPEPSQVKPAAPTPLLFNEGAAPSLDSTAVRKMAGHYEIERKDADVRAFMKELETALTNADYPEATKQVLLRTVEDQANPGLGFVKLFAEQAKKMTPSDRKVTGVELSFEVADGAVRVVIHRNGALGGRELALLRTHFGGVVPDDAAAARDKAEALNVMGKDGRRLFFDLYRVLSDMPGARLGVATGAAAQNGAGTDYWIELPKPAAPEPEAAPPPLSTAEASPPPSDPAASRGEPAAQGVPIQQQPEGLVQPATTAPIMSRPTTIELNAEVEAADSRLQDAIAQAMRRTSRFAQPARAAASLFLSNVGLFMYYRGHDRGSLPVTLAWQVTPQETTIAFRSSRELSASELEDLEQMFRNRPSVRQRIEASGGRVYAGSGERSFMGSGSSVWVVFPAEASSQADGFAGETSEAGSSASDVSPAAGPRPLSAIARGKISMPTPEELRGSGASAESVFWARFRPGDATPDYQRLIHPLIESGGTRVQFAFDDGPGYRAQLRAADAASAARQASLLAEDPAIAEVIVHPAAFARLGLPPSPLSAAERAPVTGDNGGSAALENGGAVLVHEFFIRLGGQGYDHGRRRAMKNAAVAAMSFLLTRTPYHPVTARWESDNMQARLLLAVEGDAFGADDVARLRSLFGSSPLGARLLAAGGRVQYHGASLWIDMPRQGSLAPAAPAAAPESARPTAWRTFTLDSGKHNPQDQAFRQAVDALEQALSARYGAASPEVLQLTRRFVDRASRFAKERARLQFEKIFVEWRLREDGEFELSVRRESLQPKSFQSNIWQSSLQGMNGIRELLENAGARVLNEPVQAPGQHSHRLALLLPRPERLPSALAAATRNAPPAPPAEPAEGGTHAEKARLIMRRFAKGVLAQGDERGPTVLYSAGDLFGAVSAPEDLAQARRDIVDTGLSSYWAKIAAAAAVIARHGNRADDEARLRQAVANVNWGSEHLFNPLRRRVAEALATLLATDNPERLDGLARELRGIEESEAGGQMLTYALYLVLARHGGPEYRDLLVRRVSENRSEALADYLRRNDPDFLRHYYLQWRQNREAPQGLVNRLLTLYAIGDYAEAAELPYVMRLVLSKWGSSLSVDQVPIAGAMLGRYMARLGLYDGEAKREIQRWVELDLNSYNNWNKSITAAEVLGQAGTPEDAALLERMLRYNPGQVSSTNEITQAAAAMSWALLVNRTGLIDRYMTENEPGENGQPPRTRIVKMLTDPNAIVNKAALEAVRLYFTTPRSAMPQPAPARPAALAPQQDHPRFTTGPLARPEVAFERISRSNEEESSDPNFGPWLRRLSDERLAAIKAWTAVMKEVLGPLLGDAVISRDIRAFPIEDEASASVILAWTLFQDQAPAVPAAVAARAKQLVLLLLHLMSDPADAREAKLARLEGEVPGARRAYEATAAVAAIPGARFGYDFDENRGFGPGQSPFKLWLALDGRAFSPPPAH